MGVQIIPQDVGHAARFVQGFAPAFSQGFGDISKQLVQQEIRENLAQRATDKLGPDVPQSIKDIFLAQSIMNQQPDFSRALGIMINKEAQNAWKKQRPEQKNAIGPPSNIKEDQISENPELDSAYPNYDPGPYRPPQEPPADRNKIELPGFQTSMRQPEDQGLPQFGQNLQGFRGQLPYDPNIASETYSYAPEITEFEMNMARNVPIEKYTHPSQVKQAEQDYYDTLMDPFRGYLEDKRLNEDLLKPALYSLSQKNRTGNLPLDQANFIRDSQQLVRNVDAIVDAKNDFPDVAFNPDSDKDFREAVKNPIKNLVDLGLEDFAREQLSKDLSDALHIESLVRPANDNIINKSNKYIDQNKKLFEKKPRLGFGQTGAISPPRVRQIPQEKVDSIGNNVAKIWEPYVNDGGSLFTMWYHVSKKGLPDNVMRKAISDLQKSVRFNSDQNREMGKINSAPNDYWRDQAMRNRLTGPLSNQWYNFLNILKGRSERE